MTITRICSDCGSLDLGMVEVSPGHLRKECGKCGSTGPFAVDSRLSALHRMTDQELADEVAAFCDEGHEGG